MPVGVYGVYFGIHSGLYSCDIMLLFQHLCSLLHRAVSPVVLPSNRLGRFPIQFFIKGRFAAIPFGGTPIGLDAVQTLDRCRSIPKNCESHGVSSEEPGSSDMWTIPLVRFDA